MQRWHPGILVGCHVGDVQDERTFRAVAGNDNLAVLAAFERVFKAVELQFGFWFVAAVTFDAGLVEDGFDVGGISHAGFRRGRRQLSGIGGSGKRQPERGGQCEGGEFNRSRYFHRFG